VHGSDVADIHLLDDTAADDVSQNAVKPTGVYDSAILGHGSKLPFFISNVFISFILMSFYFS
jgi:hypothetical protein